MKKTSRLAKQYVNKLWRKRVRAVYASLSELEAYDEIYNIAGRCKYKSCKKLWSDNPMLQGSTNPVHLGLAKKK